MKLLLGAIPTILLLALAGRASGVEEAVQAVVLFDGKSLEGWVAEHADGFAPRDGLLASKAGGGWLRSAKTYKNFEFELEFRTLKEGSDGGVFFRASAESGPSEPHWPVRGYQLLLSDGEGALMLFGHGTKPPRFERRTDALRTASQEPRAWQKLRVKANAPHVEILLNDVLVTTADDLDPAAGHVGLYDKAGEYEWKNLTIRVQPD